jgi:hypothetical protein
MSPFEAGIASLPYSLGSSLISMPAAWFIDLWQKRQGNMSGQKWISFLGLAIGTLGFGESRRLVIQFPGAGLHVFRFNDFAG